jgi:hypothetical protein
MIENVDNDVKHIRLQDESSLKLKSLNDHVNFTLIDIFWIADEYDCASKAYHLNALLVKEKKDKSIEYTNVLSDLDYVKNLYEFLNSIRDNTFYFDVEKFNEEDKNKYNIWWAELQVLIKNLEKLII